MMRKFNGAPGFTLIEIAISIGILSIIMLVLISLFLGSINTYGQMTNDTESINQARSCLNRLIVDSREGFDLDVSDLSLAILPATVQDAILITSARASNSYFIEDPITYAPIESSIILFYVNTSTDGITQLMRLQLFYAEDLSPLSLVPPFTLISAIPGSDIVIADATGTRKNINRATGAINSRLPLRAPQVVMNQVTSFDVGQFPPPTPPAPPYVLRITYQYVDRFGHTATTRLGTQIEPRNLSN